MCSDFLYLKELRYKKEYVCVLDLVKISENSFCLAKKRVQDKIDEWVDCVKNTKFLHFRVYFPDLSPIS